MGRKRTRSPSYHSGPGVGMKYDQVLEIIYGQNSEGYNDVYSVIRGVTEDRRDLVHFCGRDGSKCAKMVVLLIELETQASIACVTRIVDKLPEVWVTTVCDAALKELLRSDGPDAANSNMEEYSNLFRSCMSTYSNSNAKQSSKFLLDAYSKFFASPYSPYAAALIANVRIEHGWACDEDFETFGGQLSRYLADTTPGDASADSIDRQLRDGIVNGLSINYKQWKCPEDIGCVLRSLVHVAKDKIRGGWMVAHKKLGVSQFALRRNGFEGVNKESRIKVSISKSVYNDPIKTGRGSYLHQLDMTPHESTVQAILKQLTRGHRLEIPNEILEGCFDFCMNRVRDVFATVAWADHGVLLDEMTMDPITHEAYETIVEYSAIQQPKKVAELAGPLVSIVLQHPSDEGFDAICAIYPYRSHNVNAKLDQLLEQALEHSGHNTYLNILLCVAYYDAQALHPNHVNDLQDMLTTEDKNGDNVLQILKVLLTMVQNNRKLFKNRGDDYYDIVKYLAGDWLEPLELINGIVTHRAFNSESEAEHCCKLITNSYTDFPLKSHMDHILQCLTIITMAFTSVGKRYTNWALREGQDLYHRKALVKFLLLVDGRDITTAGPKPGGRLYEEPRPGWIRRKRKIFGKNGEPDEYEYYEEDEMKRPDHMYATHAGISMSKSLPTKSLLQAIEPPDISVPLGAEKIKRSQSATNSCVIS